MFGLKFQKHAEQLKSKQAKLALKRKQALIKKRIKIRKNYTRYSLCRCERCCDRRRIEKENLLVKQGKALKTWVRKSDNRGSYYQVEQLSPFEQELNFSYKFFKHQF